CLAVAVDVKDSAADTSASRQLRPKIELGEVQDNGVATAHIDGNGVTEVPVAFRAEDLGVVRPSDFATLGRTKSIEVIVVGTPALTFVIDECCRLCRDTDRLELARTTRHELQGVEGGCPSLIRESQADIAIFVRHDVAEHLLLGHVCSLRARVDIECRQQRLAVQEDIEAGQLLVAGSMRSNEVKPQLVAAGCDRYVVAELAAAPVLEQERSARAANEADLSLPGSTAAEEPVGSPAHARVVDDLAAAVAGHDVQLSQLPGDWRKRHAEGSCVRKQDGTGRLCHGRWLAHRDR